MENLIEYFDIAQKIIMAAIAFASTVVLATPSKKDDEAYSKVMKFIELFSIFSLKKQMQAALPYAIAALVAVAATIWGINALISHADKGGYSRCVAEVKTNEAEHLAKSVGAINEAFSKVQILEDELQNYEDGKASPSLERTLLNHKLRNDKKSK